MKKLLIYSLAAMLCLVSLAGCGGNEKTEAPAADKSYLTVTDAANRRVVLQKKPERVAALSPSFLSMIDSVGGTVVARSISKNVPVPKSMEQVPEVGMVFNINIESLVAAKPDLVLAGINQHEKFVPILESNKMTTIELNVRTYEDVRKTVKLLGDIYGTQDRAAKELETLEQQIKTVVEKVPKEKKRIVIMHATASSVTVEGSNSIAGCVSDILGLENVAAKALKGKSDKTPYSMETLVEQNPEIIFITSMGKAEAVENRLRKDFQNSPAWNALDAVKAGRVYALPEELFLLNPGLRYPQAVKFMAMKIYPDVVK